jgi:putative transposase
MCRVLHVNRSGFYAAQSRPPSERSRQDIAICARMIELHESQRRAAGTIKTWHLLRAEGIECGRNRIRVLRRRAGIETLRTKRFRNMRTYQKTEPAAPDLVQRGFTMNKPNQAWVGDMTFIQTRQGSICLATYIDLCTHSVTGWAIAASATAKLAVTALQNGLNSQNPGDGLICHTDQGSAYSSTIFRDHLSKNKMKPSMSRKGNCHDNAVAESFFSNLKNELTHHVIFEDRAAAELAINDYIGVYYNQQRLHQSLDYRTPAQVEALHR